MPNKLTIKEVAAKLASKEISSVELTRAVFDQIKKGDAEIHAFLELAEESAIRQAITIDKKIAEGADIHPLAGIPVAIKDNILVDGLHCTAGSKILENYVAPYDATVVKRLKEAGAVIIGKTNLDEFAMGSSTENSAFGPTKNPLDLERVPGGSSGGSAAAVAADECIYSLGSDTGGSIRQPAAFCGIVGLKPTYGAVSRYGLMALASSLDQVGPFTKTVEDAEVVFETISGRDKMDSTTSGFVRRESAHPDIKEIRIGLPNEYFAEGLDPKIDAIIREKVLSLERMGAKISGVSLPHSQYALACYYIILPAEASSNLARYDGVKYGAQVADQKSDLLDLYLDTRGQKLGAEVKRRIILGTFTLSAGYYDAYYLKAKRVVALLKKDFDRAFEEVDLLISPTTPTTAFKFGEKADNPLEMYLSDIYTVTANLVGVPAISVPCGQIGGLPVGMQITAPQGGEKIIFEVAKLINKI